MGCFASGIRKRRSARSCGLTRQPAIRPFIRCFEIYCVYRIKENEKIYIYIYLREKGWELIRMKWESVDLIRFQRFFLNVFHDSEYKGKQNKMRDQKSVWATGAIRLKWPKLCKVLSKNNFSLDCHFVHFFCRACLVILYTCDNKPCEEFVEGVRLICGRL